MRMCLISESVCTESTGPAKVVKAGNPPKTRRGGKVSGALRKSSTHTQDEFRRRQCVTLSVDEFVQTHLVHLHDTSKT